MKNLKSILLAGFLTVGAFSSAVFTSCNPDACKDVVCNNGGTCTDGTCACPAGYTGANCDTKANTLFAGTWSAKEKVNGASTWGTPYAVTVITDGSDPKVFYLQQYGNYACTPATYQVAASTSDGKAYSISSNACSTSFTGSGTMTTNGGTSTINGTYTATYGSPVTTDNVTIEMTK
jgi:hypothetical protein